MDQENARVVIEHEDSPIFYRILLGLGSLLLFFGLLSTAGSLMADRLSGNRLDSPFNVLFVPLLLYLVPSLMIAFSLARLKTSVRLTSIGVIGITFFGLAISLVGEIMKTHNYFVREDEHVSQAFNNVEIIYQKRFNLIRNLDISSKDYLAHEQRVIADIVSARKDAASATNDDEKIVAIGKFDSSLRDLFLNIEQYPNLKADKIVLGLMREITLTESQLLGQKADFNNRVTEYNRGIRLMPYALTARIFNFQPRKFVDKENSAEIYDASKLLTPL